MRKLSFKITRSKKFTNFFPDILGTNKTPRYFPDLAETLF